jgi:YVTN family beta-propeller protein
MPDLKTRFHGADRIPTPHLWEEITSREPRPIPLEPSFTRRVLVAAFALVLAIAGISFAVRAFSGSQHSGPAVTPSIMPKANGLISFQVGGSEGGISTDAVQPDGTGRQTIFGRDQNVSRVAWSPDGTRIAYVKLVQGSSRSRDGNPHWGIFTANPDGADAHKISGELNDGWPAWLTWSPDGSRIAFSSLAAGSPAQSCMPGGDATCPTGLYVMNADGTNVSQLTMDGLGEYQPSWSPDGSEIAFVRQVEPPDGLTGIFVMNADGSNVRKIASTTQGSDFAPSWSPDGSQVMFGSIRSEDWGIFVANADGTGERAVLERRPYVDDPVWSPDGTMVAFVGDPGISGSGRGSALYVMRADGTGITNLAGTPHYDVNGGIAWQPLPVDPREPTQAETPSPESAKVSDPLVSATVKVSDSPDWNAGGIAVGEGAVWVSVQGSGQNAYVARIDPVTNEVIARIPVNSSPWDIAAGAGSVWGTGYGENNSGSLQRIDPASNDVVATITVDPSGHPGVIAARAGSRAPGPPRRRKTAGMRRTPRPTPRHKGGRARTWARVPPGRVPGTDGTQRCDRARGGPGAGASFWRGPAGSLPARSS